MEVAVTLVREWFEPDTGTSDTVVGSCVECGRAIEEGDPHYDFGTGKLCQEDYGGLTSCLYRFRMRSMDSG